FPAPGSSEPIKPQFSFPPPGQPGQSSATANDWQPATSPDYSVKPDAPVGKESPLPLDKAELEKRYTDSKLQTGLPTDDLQKRLLKIFYDARTSIEDQGVNILYLALGMLDWYE